MKPTKVSPVYFWATVAATWTVLLGIFIAPGWSLPLILITGVVTIIIIIASMFRAIALAEKEEKHEAK